MNEPVIGEAEYEAADASFIEARSNLAIQNLRLALFGVLADRIDAILAQQQRQFMPA